MPLFFQNIDSGTRSGRGHLLRLTQHSRSDAVIAGSGFGESMGRTYGRQYKIQSDAEVGRFHVTLGKESIGFHKTLEGAKKLAVSHAKQVSLPQAKRAFAISQIAPPG